MKAGTYKTKSGSHVTISGDGIIAIVFDWFEEDACCDCVVQTDVRNNVLYWGCEHCGGGFANLTLEASDAG